MEGLDFNEIFSHVARIEAIRLLLAFVASRILKLYQIDVKSAFLNDFITEKVNVKQSVGFENPDFPNYVFKLSKTLYVLNKHLEHGMIDLKTFLLEKGFQMKEIDKTHCFLKHSDNQLFV